MKKLILISIFIPAAVFADNTIYPKDAANYLAKLNCIFSAYATYKGPDAGILKKGQAYTNAFCVASYSEGGAKKREFCWLRSVDLKNGVYIDRVPSPSSWRDESGQCTKESLRRILNTTTVKSSILYGVGPNKTWSVVSDEKGVSEKFEIYFKEKKQ